MGVRHSIGNLYVARLDLLRSARRPVGRRFASRLAAWLVPLARDRIRILYDHFHRALLRRLTRPSMTRVDLVGPMLLADSCTVPDKFRRTMADFDVVIASVSSAVPSHKVSQATVAERAMRVFPHLTGLAGLFATTGIESRYLCETPDWYLEDRGWEERTASFQLMA